MSLRRVLAFALVCSASAGVSFAVVACSSDNSTAAVPKVDASTAPGDDSLDPQPPVQTGTFGTTPKADAGDAGKGSTTGTVPVTTDAGDMCNANASASGKYKCGLLQQCGCDTNETCDIQDPSGATDCDTAGNIPRGHSCDPTAGDNGDCHPGDVCIAGACRPYCTGLTVGGPCPGTGLGTCAQLLLPDGGAAPNAEVCFVSCDPVAPADACGDNGCVFSAGQTNCEAIVGAGKGSGLGASCSYNTCQIGLACGRLTADAGFSCFQPCHTDQTNCAAGQSCHAFAPDYVVQGVSYGYCK